MTPIKKIIEILKIKESIGNIEKKIIGISDIKDIKKNTIVYVRKELTKAITNKGDCFLISKKAKENLQVEKNKTYLVASEAEKSFIKLLDFFNPYKNKTNYKALNSKNGLLIGPNVICGENVTFKKNIHLMGNNFIGHKCTIGNNVTLHPGVIVYDDCIIGNDVTIYANSVIGKDGFGYEFLGDKWTKIPQIGNVIIEDNVEIGSNTCVDRSTIGSTLIKEGTKIDNLVQIAHNVKIGRDTIIAGQTGIAGSAQIGNNVILAGNSKIADHCVLEDHITVGIGGTSYSKSKFKANTKWLGVPLRPMRAQLRIDNLLTRFLKK